MEAGERTVVGLNKFRDEEVPRRNLLRVDPGVMESQAATLKQLKAERDNLAVASAIEKLRKCAQGNDNLMPPIMEAVKRYATLGEICDTLREVFGEYTGVSTV